MVSERIRAATLEGLRFSAVGAFSMSLYLGGTLLIYRYLRLPLNAAATVCFVFIVSLNYWLHYSWTFRSRRSHFASVPRFICASVGGMVINNITVSLGMTWTVLPMTVVLLSGAGLVVVWNYLLSRFWIFGECSNER